MQNIRISFGKEGTIVVHWGEYQKQQRRRFAPGEMKQALGFACTLGEKDRDQPCLRLPPNIFNSLDVLDDQEWCQGTEMARRVLAQVV